MKTGYLSQHAVKAVVFWIVTTCIILVTAAGILSAWGSMAEAVANKLYYSCGILTLGSLTFLLINFLFGDFERSLFTPHNTESMPTDPAFSERLAKAKAMRNEGKQSQEEEEAAKSA